MKNQNSLIALAVGLVSGGLAFYLLYQKASEIEQKTTPVSVLVAARFIPPGSLLKSEMVEKKSIPEAFVSPGAIHDLRDVEGLMNMVPISSGEQILSNKFALGDESLALSLAPGFRAYTLEVSETSGVGNLLRPGNHVDLLTKTEAFKKETTSFVFQDLQVLAVGQKTDWKKHHPSSPGSTAPDESENIAGYSTVTLSVTPEQAEIMMFLEGRPLRLVLRAPQDDEMIAVPAQSEAEVMSKLGHFSGKKPEKNIEIIRGNSKQGE